MGGLGQGEHFSGTVLKLGQSSSAVMQDFKGCQWLWRGREWLFQRRDQNRPIHNIYFMDLWRCLPLPLKKMTEVASNMQR